MKMSITPTLCVLMNLILQIIYPNPMNLSC